MMLLFGTLVSLGYILSNLAQCLDFLLCKELVTGLEPFSSIQMS